MRKITRLFLAVFLGLLAVPLALFADNCGSWSDCFNMVAAAAATAASIATGTALLSWISGLFGGDVPDSHEPSYGLGDWLNNLVQNWTWSGMAFALAGAAFSGAEKFGELEKLVPSFNPGTGLPILGTHLENPLSWLGTTAKVVGGALALGTQFKDSYDIANGPGSLANRAAKEVVSLGTNVAVALGSAALIEVTAPTGPGIALGFAGAAGLGAAGEAVKSGLYSVIDHFSPPIAAGK